MIGAIAAVSLGTLDATYCAHTGAILDGWSSSNVKRCRTMALSLFIATPAQLVGVRHCVRTMPPAWRAGVDLRVQ